MGGLRGLARHGQRGNISAEDFAVAAVDEIDNAAHDKERFAVAAADDE